MEDADGVHYQKSGFKEGPQGEGHNSSSTSVLVRPEDNSLSHRNSGRTSSSKSEWFFHSLSLSLTFRVSSIDVDFLWSVGLPVCPDFVSSSFPAESDDDDYKVVPTESRVDRKAEFGVFNRMIGKR